jgi:hypothetical protein
LARNCVFFLPLGATAGIVEVIASYFILLKGRGLAGSSAIKLEAERRGGQASKRDENRGQWECIRIIS